MKIMTQTSRIVLATTAFVLLLGAAAAQADAVDDYVTAQMRRQHVPGMALAVVKDGKPVRVKGYGLANVELNVPVTAETVFKIGSVSKQFIAIGVMLLVNDGKVALQDPVAKYLQDAPPAWRGITVEHVLNHSSGLVRESPGFAPFQLQSDAETIRKAYDTPLRFQPGEKFEYCNLGYFISAEIIRKVSGMEWPAFLEQRVFKPLGMNATRATSVAAIIPNRANGYAFNDGKVENATPFIAVRPSGAFVSTLTDMLKWNSALEAGNVLPKPLLERMWTPYKTTDGKEQPYGLGWYLDPVNGHAQIHHGGALTGFRSEYTRFVDDKLAVIVLANGEYARTDAIAVNVAAQYIKDLVPKRVAATIDAALLEQYAGQYQFVGSPTPATITRRDAALVLTNWGIETSLQPLSPTTFFMADDPRTEAEFAKDANGAVTHMILKAEGTELARAARLP
jgi:D-alanyl-D-alanine carboxypeptidase